MHALFASVILYGQVAVMTPAAQHPVLLWGDDEVAQGFTWAEGAVSFGVPDHDGDCLIEVDTARHAPFTVAGDALWAVAVPFTATSATVDVGTVLGERPVPIAPGAYQLVFQARPGAPDHAFRLDILFVRGGPPDFAILRQGSLGSDHVLRGAGARPGAVAEPPGRRDGPARAPDVPGRQ